MNKFVKLIVNPVNGQDVYQLIIHGLTEEQKEILFLPKLEKIDFLIIDNELIVQLGDQTFESEFANWISNLYEELVVEKKLEDILIAFQKGLKKHMLLFNKKKKPSLEKIRGLFGELLELKRALTVNSTERLDVLNGWHRPAPANHDFDYSNYSLEVKTLGRSKSRVNISSENQLCKYDNKDLYLKISIIDSVNKSSIDSLGELYNEIKGILGLSLGMHFENKCSSDAYFKYFGPEHTPLDYKLFELESSFYEVDQDHFPRLKTESLPNGISNTKYEIDLSSIQKFKVETEPCPQN